jgi:hypothetical protein
VQATQTERRFDLCGVAAAISGQAKAGALHGRVTVVAGKVAAEARMSLRLSGQAEFMGWSVPRSITFSNWSLAVGP